ncbi:MAG: type II toxin-antitoxin system VapC family toxin [Firmicutes bacterium]|nr:type II toxin-antitoxin system VapC family toxin [Bacillota bacterium]
MLVLDASVALSWCFEDEEDEYSLAVLEQAVATTFLVPSIWPLEIANVLLVAERRGRITRAETAQFIDLLGDLAIHVEPEPCLHFETDLMDLARRHQLSAYDASYLRLALKKGLALVTKDASLIHAAKDEGVALWTEAHHA